jgi:hypothetical protein
LLGSGCWVLGAGMSLRLSPFPPLPLNFLFYRVVGVELISLLYKINLSDYD